MRPRPVRHLLAGMTSALVLVSGCTAAYDPTPVPSATTTTSTPTATASSTPAACQNATTSYAPASLASQADDPTIRAIRARGYLRVGVSADTLLFGARNPLTGGIEGFDLSLIHI